MNNWKLNDWGTKCSLVYIHSRKKKLKSTCPVGEYISVFTFLDFNIVIRGGMLMKHAWIFNSYFRSTGCLAILAVWKVLEQLQKFSCPTDQTYFFPALIHTHHSVFVTQGMAGLVQTIEECWDQDAEARLTAQCVAERVAQFQSLSNCGSEHSPIVTTVVNKTNITPSSKESTI